MTMSDVVSFIPGLRRSGFWQQPDARSAETPPRRSGPSSRVKAALMEQAQGDRLLSQLRELLVGPHQNLCEARFEEMLDILAEQNDHAGGRFAALEAGLSAMQTSSSRMDRLFAALDEKVELLSTKTDDDKAAARESLESAIAQLRGDFEVKMAAIADTLQACIDEVETETRNGLLGLTNALAAQVSENGAMWERERSASLTSLETRIAQWRAEIEDDRKQDMDEVASAIMAVGQRLKALREQELG